MIEELINQRIQQQEKQEEEKIMQAIRQNYRDTRMNRKIDEQLKVLNQRNKEKYYDKLCLAILISWLVAIAVALVGRAVGL